MIIRACTCKFGYMDSQIKTISFEISEEVEEDLMISKFGARFETRAQRPMTMINVSEEGFRGMDVNLDESDSQSYYTPGSSMYQISLHRQETKAHIEEDDF
jgi:hypothetical protein